MKDVCNGCRHRVLGLLPNLSDRSNPQNIHAKVSDLLPTIKVNCLAFTRREVYRCDLAKKLFHS